MDFTVWYRTDGKHGQNNGTLTVDGQTVTFTGKNGTTDMSHVLELGRKKVGLYGQQWAAIRYDEGGTPQNAYFADRRLLGWKGMLGGNQAIVDALRAASPDAPQSPPAGMQPAGAAAVPSPPVPPPPAPPAG